jgi:ribonuclease HI
MEIAIMTDGASHNNGGLAGIGVEIVDTANPQPALLRYYSCIGEATNSVAEYTAMLMGVDKARTIIEQQQSQAVTKAVFLTDSNLVVSQLNGDFQCNQANLRTLRDSILAGVLALKRDFGIEVVIDHIPREYNAGADELSRIAIEENLGKQIEQKYPFLKRA